MVEEVGWLSTKENAPTRQEYECGTLLSQKFEKFVTKQVLGEVELFHWSNVIGVF